MNGSFVSGGLTLARYLAEPVGKTGAMPAMVLCHGYPSGGIDARQSAGSFPELCDRVANELGWSAMTFTFRGCATSEGDFSMQGWVDDLRAAISHIVSETQPSGIWLVGNNTGGSLALCVAADDPRVNGCALLGARADFDDWAAQPRRFLEHSREIGTIRRAGFPPSFDEWSRELRRFRPADAAKRYAPRPLLLMHGADDDVVPTADSRVLAKAYGDGAELQIIQGAGHRLRHDPRAMAMLLGWLDRQRTLAGM
ncbi:MAG: alpha/beta hydrolase [Ilumatobacteraceae bacterium]